MVAAVLYWIGQLFGAVGNRCTRVAGWCAACALKCDSAVRRVAPPDLPPQPSHMPILRISSDTRQLQETTAFGKAASTWRPGHENTMTARNLRLVKPTRRS